ncbi:IS481 family transposase [Microbacterium sp. cx-59]|uniref:IS481 family transposase n=1 Tax=Microbacterium sp. cx-59 TaxID=2891207 RepID=UPI001E3A2082|nr:IS481 family transposase [Microbacterium sp. cx-59]MCC4907704.1 IS481 family transposase [Microbacterium sp. cx-59]
MTHRNAPLTPEGRKRLIERCRTRPIAHVAAEMGISRATASKWVNRYKQFGEIGLLDRSSAPARQPTATSGRLIKQIEAMRHGHKWPASRISFELQQTGNTVSRRTVTRVLAQLGLSRRKFIDPSGESNRQSQQIRAERLGHMVHLDVKKTGRIPDGGGWRVHGKDSDAAKAVVRAKTRGAKIGYVFLHSAIDGYSRLAYTEALPDKKAATAVAFLDRARGWFAVHRITQIERIVTDNGSCYRAHAFRHAMNERKHQRTTPYTPRHNGKVERYNRILAEEFLYVRTWHSEVDRAAALTVWNWHYTYHRPHGAHDEQPPASATPSRVNNVLAFYT